MTHHDDDVTVHPTAVQLAHVVRDHGRLDVRLHEDANDARPFKLVGVLDGPVAEEFDPDELPQALCYLAALVQAVDDEESAAHSRDAVAVEARLFLRAVTR